MNRDFKGIWIPKEVWLCKDLLALDKVLLAEISSLDNEEHCIAGNEYFAEFCGVTERTISASIKRLTDLGYIETVSFDGRHRVLSVSMQSRKIFYADTKNFQAINISNNTTNKYTNTINSISNAQANTDILPNCIENNIVVNNTDVISEDSKSDYDSHGYSKSDFLGSASKRKSSSKKSVKKNLYQSGLDLVNTYTLNLELQDALIDYFKWRLERSKEDTSFAIYLPTWEAMLKRLFSDEFSGKDLVKIVRDSTIKQWRNFYEDKSFNKNDKDKIRSESPAMRSSYKRKEKSNANIEF